MSGLAIVSFSATASIDIGMIEVSDLVIDLVEMDMARGRG